MWRKNPDERREGEVLVTEKNLENRVLNCVNTVWVLLTRVSNTCKRLKDETSVFCIKKPQ